MRERKVLIILFQMTISTRIKTPHVLVQGGVSILIGDLILDGRGRRVHKGYRFAITVLRRHLVVTSV